MTATAPAPPTVSRASLGANAPARGPAGRLFSFVDRHERECRRAVAAIAVIAVVVAWIRVALSPPGDLHNHREFAVRFLAGTNLYAGGLNIPYTPFWALAHGPAAVLPALAMPALLFPIGIVALAVLLAVLDRIFSGVLPIDRRAIFWVAAGSVALASRFVVRDLLDTGPNLVVVALTWSAVLLWARGRLAGSALCLGLAVAMKLTPVIFIAYFAWKREWRVAAWALAAAVAFSLLPAAWMGWGSFTAHMTTWAATLAGAARQMDPRIGVLGLESPQNLSLRPALARFLMHMPAGDDGLGRFVHPLNVDLGRLSPTAARAIVLVVLAIVIGAAMWVTRKPARSPGGTRVAQRTLFECAGVGVLGLLLSPITWRAHAVAILPACRRIK
jgi:alpha-1,2-mannosyltransferase